MQAQPLYKWTSNMQAQPLYKWPSNMFDTHTVTLNHSDTHMPSDTLADVHGNRHHTVQQTRQAWTTELSTNY